MPKSKRRFFECMCHINKKNVSTLFLPSGKTMFIIFLLAAVDHVFFCFESLEDRRMT